MRRESATSSNSEFLLLIGCDERNVSYMDEGNIRLAGHYIHLKPLGHHHVDALVTASAADPSLYQWSLVPQDRSEFRRLNWVLANMSRLGISERWLTSLGVLKALGAVGLLVGLRIPQIGVAAAIGLVLFFVGAIVTALRAHWYGHFPYPAVWLVLALGSLILRVASL